MLPSPFPSRFDGQVRMPVVDTLPIAYFVGSDTGLKQTTQQDWKNKWLNVEEVAAFVPIARKVARSRKASPYAGRDSKARRV